MDSEAVMSGASRALRLAKLALALVLACAGVAAAQGEVSIDPDQVIGEVGPYVYGANYGPLSAIPLDLFDEAEAAGITFLRYPGGNWGENNNIAGYHLDMLMGIARVLGGAAVSVQARLEDGTPEQAAALVRMANQQKQLGIRYWYIGNEPSFAQGYSVERLNREWRAIALAMKEVDPEIVLIGPEPHQWNGLPNATLIDSDGVEWVRGFLEVNGDLVDVVAVHRYPFPRSAGNPNTTVDDLRQNTVEWTQLISRLRALAEEVTGRTDLRFAVSEANSHWSATSFGVATNDSHANAIWWADVLGKLINDGAWMVSYFDLHSSDGRGSWGMLSNTAPRPSYYVYQLYQHLGSELLSAESSEPFVSVIAARRDDGALTVILTNMNEEPRTLDLRIAGPELALAEARLLDPATNAAVIADPRDVDGAVTLPGLSALLLVFTP